MPDGLPAGGGAPVDAAAPAWMTSEKEALGYLKDLLRIDTTNPPGNERAAAEFIKGVLAREGIACELFEKEPSRTNLVARLKGSGQRAPLLLSGHLDVVPAIAEA